MAGKRVNFACRSVIAPDPKIKFNEVGVPKIISMELTVPERITEWNIAWLKEFVERGPKVYPGANYIIRPDGKKKKITPETKEQLLEELEPGFIVERHLLDKDIGIFNRQPSLHRMSIMCHRIKILPGRALRLNPSVCFPYNADFDGDEMNLHIPQNEESRSEAEILMEVQTQIVTPKNGLNVIGCVEDAISGNYLLTKNLTLSKEEAMQILFDIGVEDVSDLKRYGDKVDGKVVFSVILPKGINLIDKNKAGEEVVIKDGKLISGYLDKNIIGEEKGCLIRELYNTYEENFALDVIGKMFRLGIRVLQKLGLTNGIGDVDLPVDAVKKIEDLKNDAFKEVEKFIEIYRKGELVAYPGKTIEETLEIKILELLNKVRNAIGNIVAQYTSANNQMLILISSGARGNLLNLAQMAACVGQQSLRGQRIGNGYRNRTLSHFKQGDLGYKARGFIERGFKDGLDPHEFFFGAMTGRDSLMDTALRTPKSGYLYRRLSNALQDLKVEYDYSVRDANRRIVQFIFGDDGIDIAKSEGGTININRIIDKVISKND